MSQALIISLIIIGVAINLVAVLSVAAYILGKVKADSAKCAEQNRVEREAACNEYKALAEKVTEALIHIGVKLSNFEERLPSSSKATTALMPRGRA